jgi:hypothetical protein
VPAYIIQPYVTNQTTSQNAEALAAWDTLESMVAIMFDVLVDDIDHFSFVRPDDYPNGVRVELHLKSGEKREHLAKNDEGWVCAVLISAATGTPPLDD